MRKQCVPGLSVGGEEGPGDETMHIMKCFIHICSYKWVGVCTRLYTLLVLSATYKLYTRCSMFLCRKVFQEDHLMVSCIVLYLTSWNLPLDTIATVGCLVPRHCCIHQAVDLWSRECELYHTLCTCLLYSKIIASFPRLSPLPQQKLSSMFNPPPPSPTHTMHYIWEGLTCMATTWLCMVCLKL